MESTKRILRVNGRQSASWISALFFWWTMSIFKNGYRQILTVDDLCEPLQSDRSNFLGEKLSRRLHGLNFGIWKEKCERSVRPNLRLAIAKQFWKELTMMGIFCFANDVMVRLILPFLIGNLLKYYRAMSHEAALKYGIYIIVLIVLLGVSHIHYNFNGKHYGMNIRTAVSSLIYRKVLKLSKIGLGDTAPGTVVNLLSNDVSRFEAAVTSLHSLWTAPILTCICGYLIWREIQWHGMIGMAIVFFTVPFQSYGSKLSSKYRNATATRTDKRIRFMDEIISGVQVIKMYAWELSFANLVKLIRREELKFVLKNAYVRAMYMSLTLFTTRMALCGSVLSIFLLYDRAKITVAKMFVVSALFNEISSGMCETFILAIAHLVETDVAFQRLEKFLNLDEKSELNCGDKKCVDDSIAISIVDATARWNFKSDESIEHLPLDKVNVQIPKGKLIGIIGPVGAGKSSLLQAVLQELPLETGSISINGSISYASQEPWIFPATVRQNILFGQEMDQNRYEAVVQCTDLLSDLEQLSEGDLTMISESGLSGGQKARINLARAVYRDADIYLLDDPLSAVDAHVGVHLFNKCIGPKGFLANTSRILVTHQVRFLQQADWVLVLRDGKVEIQGTFDDILSSDGDFASILSKTDLSNADEFNKSDSTENVKKLNVGEVFSFETADEEMEVKSRGSVPFELESSSKGQIKGSLLSNYFNLANQLIMLSILAVLFFLTQFFASAADVWVARWTQKEEIRTTNQLQMVVAYDNMLICSNHTSHCSDIEEGDFNMLATNTYAYIYGAIIILLFVTSVSRSIIFFRLCITVSENLHDKMFKCVIDAKMRFFNKNPCGRILNRFSSDIGVIDETLPRTFLDAAQIILKMLGALFVVIINVNPIFVAVMLVLLAVFAFIRKVYLKISQDIKRFEGMTKSPVFTHISASITGLPTIRACNAEGLFQQQFDSHQDLNIACSYMYMSTASAFSLTLEILIDLFVISVTIYFLLIDTGATGDRVGLAITQSLTLTGLFKNGIRKTADVANQLMSVERAVEYTICINPEKQPDVPTEAPSQWPSMGKIEFKNVFYRYFTAAEPVLRDLSFVIQPREKIGIVGRTGAGKSSLIGSLFRLACVEGNILIDDIDTAQLNLKDLRSKITIIPQDPVLFSGTLRRNLDPFDKYSDADIWNALEHVELKETACNTLQLEVMAKGSNFSVGQRQLLCLARAILRKNTILVLDEATANVDPRTDFLIQRTVRTKLADCTVLTVAHRLNTIIDSDRVLVMDGGVAIEYDAPFRLLSKSNGMFKGMVEALGSQEYHRLFMMSQNYKTDEM